MFFNRSSTTTHRAPESGLTWMADAGVRVHVLRTVAGHGSLTTQRYLHPNLGSATAAGTALSARLAGRRPTQGPHLVPNYAG
ncbi:hypothetical protein Aph01nite_22320 [Acrocarpospora phusangensis]|uniref:Uncharacterized protein n=1 Tax=Acrocarpospora phusangensis TaxID=1070424 RepID=A0A919QCT1_9ACTN|nr:hypothetical protein Aph01nite_22320 [Acrocarpospora phusangensis]